MHSSNGGELGWAKELVEKFSSGSAHTFILHLNVSDYVRGRDGYVSLKKFITDQLLTRWQIVVFYDRASGIHFLTKEMKEDFMKVIKAQAGETSLEKPGQVKGLPKEPEVALPMLEKLVRTSPAEATKILGREIKEKFATIIIGFAETIFPDGKITSQSVADRTNIITMAQWARRSRIEQSGNLILMMTNNLNQVSPALRSTESNIECIRIPYPDFEQRLDFIGALPDVLKATAGREVEIKFGEDVKAIAAACAGLTRNSIRDLAWQAVFLKESLDIDFIWERKAQILEQMSGGLLEIVRPELGFEVIGGLESIKSHFLKVATAIKKGDVLLVPQGMLMIGPPGTGKSVLAEALAYELGFSLVKIKNMRSMWHGESENRQELIFGLIEALGPVVVFEDEIDQQEQARGNVFHGDSGVTARMTAAKLAFMSDVAHRGIILWVAASNRPDLMDQAMLRPGRFDDLIPFFPPDEKERVLIFRAIFLKMTKQAEKYAKQVSFEVSEEDLVALASKMDPNFTGAEIELVCHRGVMFAAERENVLDGVVKIEAQDLIAAMDDFIPSRDEAQFNQMIDMALLMVNSARMIPPRYLEKAKALKTMKRS